MSDGFVQHSQTSTPLNLEGTDDIILSSKELQQINDFIPQIDISSSLYVSKYATDIQEKISSSCSILLTIIEEVPTNSEEITQIIEEISALTTETKVNFFEKQKIKLQYTAVAKKISNLADVFINQQLVLIGKSRELKDLEKVTSKYRRWLYMHIKAGTMRLDFIQKHQIPILETKAKESTDLLVIDEHRSILNACSRFQNRLTSLQISMSVANLSLSQIRLTIKDFDNRIEEITKIIKNTIPNWRNQIKISVGVNALVEAKKKQNKLMFETTEALSKQAKNLQNENATNIDLYEVNVSLLNILKNYDEVSQRNNSEIFLMQKELKRLTQKT